MPPVTASCPIAGAVAPGRSRAVPPYWLEGASGYEDGMRIRDLRAAPMVIYVFTDWCGYCKRFDEQVLSSAALDRYFSQQTVRVRVNPEMGAADKRIAASLEVKGYPTFLLLPAGASTPVRCSMYRADIKPFELLSPQEFIDKIEDENRRHFRRLVADGERRRSEGDVAGALQALDKAVAAIPDDADVYLERGKAHEQAGDLDGALRDYAAVAALRPDAVSVYERATRALREERRFDEAAACATDWLARDAHNGLAFLARAEAHQGRGDPIGARQDAQHACAKGISQGCRWTGAAR